MSPTRHLNLPMLAAGQAQKHVTLNEALVTLDALVHITVAGVASDMPPASPEEGERRLIGEAPTGDWAGHAGELAVVQDGAWRFHAPSAGWLIHDAATDRLKVFVEDAWRDVAAPAEAQNLLRLGIAAEADAANPLTARLNNALLTALPTADGGDGDLRLKLNKEAVGDTASLVFQTGFSGRAEIGAAGGDDLSLKVSPNGSTWFTGLVLSKDTGRATMLGLTVPDAALILSDDGDATKQAQFNVSAISPGVTRIFSLPNVSGTLALLANFSQTFPGQTIFSNAACTFGSSSAAASYGLGSGATASANVKAVDIGTGGLAGSITNVTIGSNVTGALGSLTIQSPAIVAPKSDARLRSLESVQVVVPSAAAVSVAPPSSGGVVIVSAVDASAPRNGVASILAYDVGASPELTTLVLGAEAENLGTTALTGTSGAVDRMAFAVDGSGNLRIQNRLSHGLSQQVCLTFINGFRSL